MMKCIQPNPSLSLPSTYSLVTAILDRGCEFEGKLCFYGTIQIGGIFRGEIYTPDTLIINEGAQIHGKIEAGTILISGEVHGILHAKYRIEIHRPAIFKGDIFTPSLSVGEGVLFEGSSKMAHLPNQKPLFSL